ncbi:MAG: hypothetical protein JWN38_890 [Candidatus Saccharibacteria bacterium]|nr:hypothetical protein [Candidatus Saccharibacteria bacterium]
MVPGPAGEITHEIIFNTSFEPEQVRQVLRAPLAELVPPVNEATMLGSLRQQTRPLDNRFGKDTASRLTAMRSDLQGLLQTLRAPVTQVQAEAHVYDSTSVQAAARDVLLDMKPARLKALCQAEGVPVDELLFQRRVGARALRLYDLVDCGTDPELLRSRVIADEFLQKVVRRQDGFSIAYIPRHELSSQEAEQARYLQYVKRLSTLNRQETRRREQLFTRLERSRASNLGSRDKLLAELAELDAKEQSTPRWLVSLHQTNIPRHVVVPIIRLRERPDRHQHTPQIIYDGARTSVDAATNTIRHYSPLIGSALLAGNVDASIYEAPLNKFYSRNPNNRRKTLPLPETAADRLPTLLATQRVAEYVAWTRQSRALRRAITDRK